MGASGTNSGDGSAPAWTAAWELLLPTASAPARRRGRTLQAALREAVRTGRLAAGTRLPASRELAADLGVSRGLVTDAYEQLTAEGYLRSGRGSGTWVTSVREQPGAAVADRAAVPGAAVVAGTAVTGPGPGTAREQQDVVSFRPGTPDLSLFPRAAWASAQRRVLAELPHADLGYPDPRGAPRLRRAVADLLARRRGVVADPERVVICAGVAQAITLVGLVLRSRGHRTVAVEDPGSPPHTGQFGAVDVEAVPVPLDEQGLDLGALAASGATAAVLTPVHQFPLGLAYSAERRAELLAWVRAGDRLLLEDDYDGEFRYDRAPVGALQGLDPGRVAYAGSVSKSLAPGLRLGWLVVPDWMLDETVARKRHLDLGNPVLEQEVFATLVERGEYDRHLRRSQREYRSRRDELVAAVAASLPGASVTGIAAGLHVIVSLPERCGPEELLVRRAQRAGVAVSPLSAYGTVPDSGGGVRLVLGYAHLARGEIARGVALLARAVLPRAADR